ncbi:DUF5763 domain-containing protein [Agromyces sp. NPDC058136]|uniref:DUF5763 domain-containing protein n=1 Tax=Agromyces sp. NPDC058136 TaxID=3346354 RepID=UPI0036D9863E
MTDQTTCPTFLEKGPRAGEPCGRPAKYDGYCGFHKTSAETPDQTAPEERRSTPARGQGSEPASALAEDVSAEPTPAGEVADAETAHTAPKADERPISSAAQPPQPKPAPPAAPYQATMMTARGTVRRVQALTTLGYTPRAIAHACGLSDDSVWWLLIAPPREIQTRTHHHVVTAYNRLKVTPLDGATADRARALADIGHWAGPYDWDDIDRDPIAPHPTARKAWDSDALAEAIATAKLEQGEPEAFSTDTVLEARAEAARARVDLQNALEAAVTARNDSAAANGELAGARERIDTLLGDLTAVRDQLAAAGEERAALARELTEAHERLTSLAAAVPITEPDAEPLAPVTHIDHPEFISGHLGEFVVSPALAADVSITIERTERGGVHVVFPAALLDGEAR